jgi:hypothetical protein
MDLQGSLFGMGDASRSIGRRRKDPRDKRTSQEVAKEIWQRAEEHMRSKPDDLLAFVSDNLLEENMNCYGKVAETC